MDDALRSPVNSASRTQANQGVFNIELQPCSAVQTVRRSGDKDLPRNPNK
jgi:hypothetical protein